CSLTIWGVICMARVISDSAQPQCLPRFFAVCPFEPSADGGGYPGPIRRGCLSNFSPCGTLTTTSGRPRPAEAVELQKCRGGYPPSPPLGERGRLCLNITQKLSTEL